MHTHRASLVNSAGRESICNADDPSSIPGLGRSTGEGIGYPLQYSGLKDSMDYRLQSMGSQRVGTEYYMAVRINDLVSPEVISKSPRHNDISRAQEMACYLGLCLYQFLAQAAQLFMVIGVSM